MAVEVDRPLGGKLLVGRRALVDNDAQSLRHRHVPEEGVVHVLRGRATASNPRAARP